MIRNDQSLFRSFLSTFFYFFIVCNLPFHPQRARINQPAGCYVFNDLAPDLRIDYVEHRFQFEFILFVAFDRIICFSDFTMDADDSSPIET